MDILVDKPSVEIENNEIDDEELLSWEHALDLLPGEEEVYVATKKITDEIDIPIIEINDDMDDDMGNENESLERTLQQEYEQNTSCEYQVNENLMNIIHGDGQFPKFHSKINQNTKIW